MTVNCIAVKTSPFTSLLLLLLNLTLIISQTFFKLSVGPFLLMVTATRGGGFFRNLNVLLFFYMPLSSLNSLKVEMEKMTNEKGEMHRHYIMVFICYIYFLNTHNCKCIALQIWPCLYKAFLVLPQWVTPTAREMLGYWLSLLSSVVVSHKRVITRLLYIFMNILTSS